MMELDSEGLNSLIEVLKIKDLYLKTKKNGSYEVRKIANHLGVAILSKEGFDRDVLPYVDIPRDDGFLNYMVCRCCDFTEFLYHPGENIVSFKSLDEVSSLYDGQIDKMVNEVIIKLEDGKFESGKSEVDYFVEFIERLKPKKPVRKMTRKELKSSLPAARPAAMPNDHDEKQEMFRYNLNFLRDFGRSYAYFVSKTPMTKKEFKEMMRSVDNVPKFVKEKLGWEKDSMIEEAMIFFIFNKRCGNFSECDNFSGYKKCSACKMVAFCSNECFERSWEEHHKHCCEEMVAHKFSEITRTIPQYLDWKLQELSDRSLDIVNIVIMETFCRELFRKIVSVFMEALENTGLLMDALMRRGLVCEPKFNEKQKEIVYEGDPKYVFAKSKIHTVIKEYKEPVIEMKVLKKQMEETFGRDNFLTLALDKQKYWSTLPTPWVIHTPDFECQVASMMEGTFAYKFSTLVLSTKR